MIQEWLLQSLHQPVQNVAAKLKKVPAYITGHPTERRIVKNVATVHTDSFDQQQPTKIWWMAMVHVLTDFKGLSPLFFVANLTISLTGVDGESSYTQIRGKGIDRLPEKLRGWA